ncbi:YceI family protein [Mannheimia indoligenes]|uniref:YceI family protein n=1 Tax=Mannheimia indoligenes TaxID=3103145 RepID=A0ABU7ZCV3_9PAST
MKKIVMLVAAIAAVSANAATYKIDPYHANARFSIDHFGTSSNVGGFYNLTGELQLDVEKSTGSIDVTIPVSSLQASSQDFTNHLKSADLFHVEKFPEMRFVSTKFHFADKKVTEVEGNLTLLGKTHPVTLKATKFNCYQSPMLKAEVCGGDFVTTIDRSQWGMNYLVDVGMTKDVEIAIQIEAAKQ